MQKITVGLRKMGFVVHARRFGGMKFADKIFSEILNAVCSCR